MTDRQKAEILVYLRSLKKANAFQLFKEIFHQPNNVCWILENGIGMWRVLERMEKDGLVERSMGDIFYLLPRGEQLIKAEFPKL